MKRVAALLMVLFASTASMMAETKLYISDFTIGEGETKQVAVNLDTDETTICHVELTVNLPSGLAFVADGNNIKMSYETSRAAGLDAESDNTTGKIIFSDLMRTSAISAGTGPIFYINIENTGLTGNATISLSGVKIKRQDKSTVTDVVTTTTNVGISGGASVSGVELSFSDNNITVDAGATVSVDVNLENEGVTIDAFQTKMAVPAGWTAEVVGGSRGSFTYNATSGVIMNYDGISGVTGKIFTVKLTAPATFAGSAQVVFDPVKVTVSGSTEEIDPQTLTLNANTSADSKPVVTFAEEETIIMAGKTGTVDVNMTNAGLTVQGFQTTIVVPEGWTADVTSTRMAKFSFNAATGKLINYTGVTGEDGALFTLSLTAPADFKGDATATIQLTNVKATVNNASVKLEDVSMTVKAKDQAAIDALAQEIQKATELLGDDDTTVDPGKFLKDAIDAAQAILDDETSSPETLKAATELLKLAEEAYKDAKAQAELDAAKAELQEEIKNATELLGDEDKTVEPGKSLQDAIDAAQAVLDKTDATVEELKAAAEELKAAEEAYQKAVEEASFPYIVKKALDSIESGEVTLALDKDYDVKAVVEIPNGKQLVVAGNNHKLTFKEGGKFQLSDGLTLQKLTIDATEAGNIVEMAAEAPENWVAVDNIAFKDLTVVGLKKALFFSGVKNFGIENFIVDNSVVEIAGDATTFDFTKGSTAVNFNVTKSTFYAATATTKSFYSSQSGQKTTEYKSDAIETFLFKNNTMYNLASGKNFFSHRQSNQKWLTYNVEANIFVNCGKSGQVIKGMNGGQGGANPTWIISKNAFNFDGADTSAAEETGDAEEPVKDSVAEVVEFKDAAAGDFTIGETTMVAREKIGDPRWLVEFVAPTDVDKSALEAEIETATALVGEDESEAAKTLNEAINDAKGVKDDANVFQSEVDKAVETLKAAEEAYKAAKEAEALAAAKEELEQEIKNATELLGEADTTADPGKALKDAIEQAMLELANEEATVESLKAATEALKAAEEAYKAATGINMVQINNTNGAVYNLSGQRVNVMGKGLYIVNGKKYINK